MSKKDKIIETIEVEDASLLPELLDGKHHVIPIVTGGDEPEEEDEVPEIIPILTLRSSVLFTGAIPPITVGRDKSINLVRAGNAEGGIQGAVLQRESDVEDPAPDDMYKVGTAARIIKILEMPNGNLTVILNGLEKIEIREYITTEPYFRARVTALRDTTPDLKSIEFEALVDSIRDVALNIINVSPSMPKEAALAIKNIDSKRGINALDWSSAKDVIAWDVLLLFGGGLTMAAALQSTGAAALVGAQATALGSLGEVSMMAGVATLVTFATEVTSNTALAATMMPLISASADALKIDASGLLVTTALAASCAFMMPVATPPNAIVFGTGRLKIGDMVKAGFWLNILGVVIITCVAAVIL